MRGCRALSDAEISDIIPKLELRDLGIFILGVRSGFRISEILSLKVKDAFKYSEVISHVTVSRCNMKGKKSGRTVALHPDAKTVLLKIITEYKLNENDYLFQSQRGVNQPLSRYQAWRVLKNAFNACKLTGKVATHSCRKTLARKVYSASGNSLLITQKALGHVSVSSTQSYLDVDSETVDNLILSLK